LSETQAFLANLDAMCAEKKKEWEVRSKLRAEEIAAVSEAIGVLNDDDALDLFKKTLSLSQTSTAMGFLQKTSSTSALRKVRNVMENLASTSSTQNTLHMVLFALKAKKVDFSKVVAMIGQHV